MNEDNTISVDYLIIGNQLVVGTSKDTARAIIDRIETEQSENSTENDEVDVEL